MNIRLLTKSFIRSICDSHDYKAPRDTVKSPIFGRLLAGWICVWRITSVFQFVKTLYKTRVYYRGGNQEEVPAILAEVYLVLSLIALAAFPVIAGYKLPPAVMIAAFWICAWKAFETLSASLYYHAFRDFFEVKKRISNQRSFLLSIADLAVICMCVAYARFILMSGSGTEVGFGSAGFFLLAFTEGPDLHFDLLLSVFVWFQISITLTQGIGFLNSKE